MTLSESLSLELIRLLRPLVAKLQSRAPALADQLERAATNAALNIAESSGRRGRDRVRVLRIAAGEAREAHGALLVAEAWGHLNEDEDETKEAKSVANRLIAVLYGLVKNLA